MDPSLDFKTLQEKIQAALVGATRSVNRVASEDLSFQRTVSSTVADRLDDQTSRLLKLSGDLLNSAAKASDQAAPSSLDDTEDIDIQWRGIVDVIDSLLEKADTCLDEYTGLVKRKDTPTADTGPKPKKLKTNDRLENNIRRANIIKPQNAFERKPNNLETGPWKPVLTSKPHATLSLEDSLSTFVNDEEKLQFKHPYEKEIADLQYPAGVYEKRDPVKFQPVETTSATWVDTYEGVLEMLEELKSAKEIAVDLEHHDFRTYNGLLSLMQISTREKDWIVDTLKPWRHRLEVLNEVFTDPSILKVFHGAFMDIVWLQRDLGLYIVGLFDTFHASDVLGYPGRSLAYLLKKFVDFDADKKYQMADWRIRPLPEEMFYYARSDTHYLLYIYDMLRNELVDSSDGTSQEQNLIELVLQKSKETSLLRYESLLADPETGHGARGWYNPLLKNSPMFNSEEFAVYRALHKWRDDIARRDDENPAFVLPPQSLTQIAKIMPSDPKALWSLLHNASQAAKSSLDEIYQLIQSAKAEGANGPSMMDFIRGNTMGFLAKKVLAEKENEVEAEIPNADELRSAQSQFWGTIPLSSVWDGSLPHLKELRREQMAIPWTSFVQGVATDPILPDLTQAVRPTEAEEDIILLETPSKEPPANSEFTLRAGRKRKVSEDEEETGPEQEGGASLAQGQVVTEEVISLGNEEERLQKRALKKARKERQRAKIQAARAAQPAEGSAGNSVDEEEAFDYTKAQSVLHAKKTNGDQKTGKFDPYRSKMTAEGPKPARRMHSEKIGKTATFKK